MPSAFPILIISHTFPPYRGIGGRRWAKFAKELAARGHQVHVICADGGAQLLGSPWSQDVQHERIHLHKLPMRYPKVLMKRPLTSIWEKVMYNIWVRLLPHIAKGNPYDKALFWRRTLLSKAEKLLAEHGIQHITVTGAPFLLLHHALLLKNAQRTLVADFRDPWTWGHVYGRNSLNAGRLLRERKMERDVVLGYDKVLCPAPTMVDHLRSTYPEVKERILHVPHAVDPVDLPQASNNRKGDDRLRLIYAGSLYGAKEAERYFDEVLAAFNACDPKVLEQVVFDLYITGHGVEKYQERVKEAGLTDSILFHPPLSAKSIGERIINADLVLIFIPGDNRDLMGTKFHEIFSLRTPVVHVGEVGKVSALIEGNRLGISLRVSELVNKLPAILSRETRITIDTDFPVEQFTLQYITDQLLREAFH